MATEIERAREAVMALRDTIRVGAYDMAINKQHATQVLAGRSWGTFSAATQSIGIQADMPTRIKAADTFLHELSHALFWAFGVEDKDDEERTVSLTASGWVCVYRDNPWLLEWLGECVGP